jgi:uncharacterized membrane protein
VSRVEGFSDAAFAFALTLLVISMDVPSSFDKLLELMRGLPAFAVCFASIVWVWAAHYVFFRRYGLEDGLTITLNCALLFVIMLYVYPLKFLFTLAIGSMFGIWPQGTPYVIAVTQVRWLFAFYGAGFIAVYGLLGLMTLRAYYLRDALELNAMERMVTREEIVRCLGNIGVMIGCMTLAFILPQNMVGLAGLSFSFIGVSEMIVGGAYGKRRGLLLQSMRASGEWPDQPTGE